MKKGNVNKDNYVNKGFTLVELIVVLIILAILAAVLIPVLTGYIEQARSKKDLRNAKALMEATQAAFVELYAINPDVKPGEQIPPVRPVAMGVDPGIMHSPEPGFAFGHIG